MLKIAQGVSRGNAARSGLLPAGHRAAGMGAGWGVSPRPAPAVPHTRGAAGAHSHGNATQQPERPQGLYHFDGLVLLPFLGKTAHNGLQGAH